MRIDDLIKLVTQSHGAEIDLLRRKGGDYSPGEDTLACFKRVALAYGVEPILVAAIYLEKHLDAIRTYIKTGKLNVEAFWEHIIDARVYLNLIHALDLERSERENPTDRGSR